MKGNGQKRKCVAYDYHNCGKKGHLSKDCLSVEGKGKGKGKDVNEVADAAVEVGGVWMIAEVEAVEGRPLTAEQLQETYPRRIITEDCIKLRNRFDVLDDSDDEEEFQTLMKGDDDDCEEMKER